MRAKFLAMAVAMSGFMMTAEAADATAVNDAKPAAVATTSDIYQTFDDVNSS